MRIKKGSQVEVWMQEAGSPVGAWRVGEVTWGNGHSYTLRWHDGGGEVSGRISRKSVRPRPPPAPVPRDLDAGDMVEVFDDDDCLWKCAEVRGPAAGPDRVRRQDCRRGQGPDGPAAEAPHPAGSQGRRRLGRAPQGKAIAIAGSSSSTRAQ